MIIFPHLKKEVASFVIITRGISMKPKWNFYEMLDRMGYQCLLWLREEVWLHVIYLFISPPTRQRSF